MGIIKFDIRHANGKRDSAVVEGQRALIGSGSHCDVRLAMDQAAYEQVLIEAVGSTLRAEARADQPRATINGLPLVASALSPDAELGIGDIRLFVSFVPDALDGPQIAAKQKTHSPLLLAALLPIFGALFYLLFWDSDNKIKPAPSDAQTLFAEERLSCPQQDPGSALAFAEEQAEIADGKRERMPFAVEEGVQAAGLYHLAAACFNSGQDSTRARDTESIATSLEQDLSDEFRARRLRLSHLLMVEDYELALRDISVLRALTSEKKGRYFEWLAQVTEQLKAKGIQ